MKIISREEALEQELKKYFTGKPCKIGHISERYSKNCACVQCALDSSRKWRKTNPKKHRAAVDRWQANNPDIKKEYERLYYKRNRPVILKRNKERYAAKQAEMKANELNTSDT